MKEYWSIEKRKNLIWTRENAGSILRETPWFVEGMNDLELESEHNRFIEYIKAHGTDKGFVPIKLPEGRLR